jgi:hypothetical protein
MDDKCGTCPIAILFAAVHESGCGPLRRVTLRRLAVAFGAYRTLVGTGAEWTCSE